MFCIKLYYTYCLARKKDSIHALLYNGALLKARLYLNNMQNRLHAAERFQNVQQLMHMFVRLQAGVIKAYSRYNSIFDKVYQPSQQLHNGFGRRTTIVTIISASKKISPEYFILVASVVLVGK